MFSLSTYEMRKSKTIATVYLLLVLESLELSTSLGIVLMISLIIPLYSGKTNFSLTEKIFREINFLIKTSLSRNIHTVCKIQDFCTIQILREINLCALKTTELFGK